MSSKIQFIPNALKGMAMGIAEVIPGVSGGTIAFITGIYENLLDSIKSFSPSLLGVFKRDGLGGVWQSINGFFLLSLICGMFIGILVGVFGITYLLENFPVLVWAFFFGLIAGSSLYVGRQITKWGIGEIMAIIVGAIGAYFITIAAPVSGNEAYWYVFLCGSIAISALMLPGLSGSFILILLGMYQYVVRDTLKEGILEKHDLGSLITLAVFALGCLFGMMTFSRILSWTFKHYKNLTLALLTGFMIGSLNKVWPWRKPVLGMNEEGEIIALSKGMEIDKILKEINLFPNAFSTEVGEPYMIGAIALMILGFGLVFLFDKFSVGEAH